MLCVEMLAFEHHTCVPIYCSIAIQSAHVAFNSKNPEWLLAALIEILKKKLISHHRIYSVFVFHFVVLVLFMSLCLYERASPLSTERTSFLLHVHTQTWLPRELCLFTQPAAFWLDCAHRVSVSVIKCREGEGSLTHLSI